MRKLLAAFALMIGFVASPPASASSAGALVSNETAANAYPDGVYYDSVVDHDQTAAAADSTVDDVYLPYDDGFVSGSLYLGSNTIFDQILFDITTGGDSSRICVMTTCQHYDLEYYNGATSAWESLSYTDTTNDFETEGVGGFEFEVPSAWDEDGTKTTVNGRTLFWVRISANEDATINSPANASEVASHAYNLEVTVEDELGDSMDGLVSEDFVVEGGTSNDFTGMRTMGNGVYQFALDSDLSDSSYTVSVHETGYVYEEVSTGVLSTIQKSVGAELQFAHIVSIVDEGGDDLTPSHVSVDSTDCTISGSTAYCALNASEDSGSAVLTVVKSGYYTVTTSLSESRDSKDDPQVETVVELVVDSTACVSGFEDIYGHWAEAYIDELYCRDVVAGKSSTIFDPSGEATRAEFLKMAILNAGYDVEGATGADFTDVSTGDWFYEYVSFGAEGGFIEGYGDGTFLPNEPINRAEALVITMRIAGVSEYDVDADWDEFDDVAPTDWFAYAVETAADEGIVEGYEDGDFRPANNITRAEPSAVVVRTYGVYFE